MGDHYDNGIGVMLLDEIASVDLTRIYPNQGSWIFERGMDMSIPDQVVADKVGAALVRSLVVDEKVSLGGSDHQPLLLTIARVLTQLRRLGTDGHLRTMRPERPIETF